MGFGSYDESEQAKQEVDTDQMIGESESKEESKHNGELEYEGMDDTDSLIDQLAEMREE